MWALFLKLIFSGLSISDCLGALILLITTQAVRIVDYNFPKRPDLFVEMDALKKLNQDLLQKTDELERDVTGLKFGMARK